MTASFENRLTIQLRWESVGTSSFTRSHDVLLPDGTAAASGRTVMVGWDAQKRGKRALTDAERAAMGASD